MASLTYISTLPTNGKAAMNSLRSTKSSAAYTMSAGLLAAANQRQASTSTLNFLQVCKQTCYEGRAMLYGRNKWAGDHAQAFDELFSGHPGFRYTTLGYKKAELIKDLTLWVPKDGRIYAKFDLQQFVDFVASDLPGLQQLHLIGSADIIQNPAAKEFSRGLDINRCNVRTTASVAKTHPQLKRAILSRNSGKLRPRGNTFFGRRPIDVFEVASIIDPTTLSSTSNSDTWVVALEDRNLDQDTPWSTRKVYPPHKLLKPERHTNILARTSSCTVRSCFRPRITPSV
jgi:hypothetical protein